MKNLFFISLLVIITTCSSNKVSKNHGIKLLDKRSEKIVVGQSNVNDVMKILGPPSFKSEFDDNVWFYVEQKKTGQSIFKLGKKKISKNNVLYLTFNNKGLIVDKNILDIDNMENIKFDESSTDKGYEKNTYLYNILTSLREKINAPTRKKK